MKNKKVLFITCLTLIVAVFVLGCQPAERPVPNTTPNQQNINNRSRTDNNMTENNRTIDNNRTGNNGIDTDDGVIGNNRTTADRGTNKDLSDRADKIVKEVTKLEDVKGATVVITERTALVGINLTSGTKGELNTTIKKRVENAVKKADKDINKVAVTADPDLFTRIGNVARDIGEGKPLSGFGKEIEEILRRITPGS